MRLADGSEVILHANTPYDPKKAHDYYLRTRKLHPRQGGGSYVVKSKTGTTYNVSAKVLAEQKVYAEHRVQEIKKNLADLAVLLRDKLQKAKEAEKKSEKPPTLAEKAQAAREASKYRDKHKTELAAKEKKANKSSGGSDKSTGQKADTVDSLKADIKKTKNNLKAAVAKQRELATAKKNG